MIRLHLVFFLILLSGGGLFADRPFFFDNETYYHSVIHFPNNPELRINYIKQKVLFDYGIFVNRQRGIPVVEFFVCDETVFEYGDLFFFKDDEFCAKGVRFYPKRSHVVLSKSFVPLKLDPSFAVASGRNSILVYSKLATPRDGDTDDGRHCIVDSFGVCRNDEQLPIYPAFRYTNSEWKELLSVRERFTVEVENDSYRVVIFSSVNMPEVAGDIRSLLRLRAESMVLDRKTPNTLVVRGKQLSSLLVPRLQLDNNAGSLRGVYVFELNGFSSLAPVKRGFSSDGVELFAEGDKSSFLVELRIFKKTILKEQIKQIMSFLNSTLPKQYIGGKKDGE